MHFYDKLLAKLKNQSIDHAFVTLHVGAGTFALVKTDNIKGLHIMHSETFEINQTKANGRRIIAVCVLEYSIKNNKLTVYQGETDIFIYPGYQFQIVDSLITNFHLPKSSLLMLVSAFIGRTQMMDIYQHAINQKYRFFLMVIPCFWRKIIIYENALVILEVEPSEILCIKIFTKRNIKEFSDCTMDDKIEIFGIIDITKKLLLSYFNVDKINIASFGSVLPQIHWHTMARFKIDSYFPEPMWGKKQRQSQLNLPSF